MDQTNSNNDTNDGLESVRIDWISEVVSVDHVPAGLFSDYFLIHVGSDGG